MGLTTTPNLKHHDDIYERLIGAYEGLDQEQSLRLSARLIMILMNHIGDEVALQEAFILAQGRINSSVTQPL
jgi:hypothetical protein